MVRQLPEEKPQFAAGTHTVSRTMHVNWDAPTAEKLIACITPQTGQDAYRDGENHRL